jgi:hypothetical protein
MTKYKFQIKPNGCMGNKFYNGFIPLLLLTVFFLSGCQKDPLKEAFKGTYSIGENNKIINEYCQSCHVHSTFVPDAHIDEMNLAYSSRLFRTTNQCRTCHFTEETFLGDTLRRHRRPQAVSKGAYKDFIQEEWVRRKELKKE